MANQAITPKTAGELADDGWDLWDIVFFIGECFDWTKAFRVPIAAVWQTNWKAVWRHSMKAGPFVGLWKVWQEIVAAFMLWHFCPYRIRYGTGWANTRTLSILRETVRHTRRFGQEFIYNKDKEWGPKLRWLPPDHFHKYFLFWIYEGLAPHAQQAMEWLQVPVDVLYDFEANWGWPYINHGTRWYVRPGSMKEADVPRRGLAGLLDAIHAEHQQRREQRHVERHQRRLERQASQPKHHSSRSSGTQTPHEEERHAGGKMKQIGYVCLAVLLVAVAAMVCSKSTTISKDPSGNWTVGDPEKAARATEMVLSAQAAAQATAWKAQQEATAQSVAIEGTRMAMNLADYGTRTAMQNSISATANAVPMTHTTDVAVGWRNIALAWLIAAALLVLLIVGLRMGWFGGSILHKHSIEYKRDDLGRLPAVYERGMARNLEQQAASTEMVQRASDHPLWGLFVFVQWCRTGQWTVEPLPVRTASHETTAEQQVGLALENVKASTAAAVMRPENDAAAKESRMQLTQQGGRGPFGLLGRPNVKMLWTASGGVGQAFAGQLARQLGDSLHGKPALQPDQIIDPPAIPPAAARPTPIVPTQGQTPDDRNLPGMETWSEGGYDAQA